MSENLFYELLERLGRMEETLDEVKSGQPSRDWFTTKEAADLLGRAHYTVREWARHGRCHAVKKGGRGEHGEWWISRKELERLQNEGLLPMTGVRKQ